MRQRVRHHIVVPSKHPARREILLVKVSGDTGFPFLRLFHNLPELQMKPGLHGRLAGSGCGLGGVEGTPLSCDAEAEDAIPTEGEM